MSIPQSDIGLFTFYMNQHDLTHCSSPLTQFMHNHSLQTRNSQSVFKQHHNHSQCQQTIEVKKQICTKKGLKYRSQGNTKRQEKIINQKKEMQSKELKQQINKHSKTQSVNKYPNIVDSLSTPALLKANLHYLTTQHSATIEKAGIEEFKPISSKKFEQLSKINRYGRIKSKPILKGIDLNSNIVTQPEKNKKEVTIKKKIKTKYSIKNQAHALSFKKQHKQQPLIYQMLKQKKFREKDEKIEEHSNKMKKGHSNLWKLPVRKEDETYLSPVKTDRKTLNLSSSLELLTNKNEIRLTQTNKYQKQSQKLLKKCGRLQKPVFLSQKSHLFRSVFIHDNQL